MKPTKERSAAWCFAIVLLLASGAAVVVQETSGPDKSPVPGYRVEKRVLTSQALGMERPYFVGLPESYSRDSDRRYPVIYVLDGLSQGLPVAKAVAELSRDKLMPELIVIAIPNVSGGRERDYTPPSMRQDHERPDSPMGKADAFLAFLRTELIPTIERDFRTAPERMLAGNSRGGLFVFYSLMTEPSLFHTRFAHSTPLWREDEHLVKRFDAFLTATPDLRGQLFLSVGGNETENMKRGFNSAADLLKKRAPRALRWWAETTPNAVHADNAHLAAPVAFRRVYEGAPTGQQAPPDASKPSPPSPASASKVVMLGTGTPAANPDRSGPATAIVVNDTAYLVDFGPGVVRRASAAAAARSIPALQPTRLRHAFVTHLHSDHTVGYADLIFSPWTLGRRVPLEVYGPRGLEAMTRHLIEAYRVDIDTRTNAEGNQRSFPDGYKVNAHEITAGVVYKDENVTVTAYATKHAMESYGYRFDTPDRSIVISGDTNPAQATIDACRGCDVLIHEVHTSAWLAARPEAGGAPPGTFRRFSEKYHTTTEQLAELARQAKPRLLVLYHYNSRTPEELQADMMKHYAGHFVIGRDLDVY